MIQINQLSRVDCYTSLIRSRAWSPWNILPGTTSAGAFYAERKSHLKLGCLSRNRSQSHSIFCRCRIHTRDTEPDLASQNFAPDHNRGRQDILLRAGSPVAADSSTDFRVGVWDGITQNSRLSDYGKMQSIVEIHIELYIFDSWWPLCPIIRGYTWTLYDLPPGWDKKPHLQSRK